MRRLQLKTQLGIIVSLLLLYSVALLVSYRIQSRAQSNLELAFHEDLAVLTRLPRLGDDLRHLELLTDQYLLTGNPAWLKERQRSLDEIRRVQAELTGLLHGAREEKVWSELDKDLAAYLAQEEHWIGRKETGHLSLANAGRVGARSRTFDDIIDSIMAMRDLNFQELQRRRLSAYRAAHATFYMSLGDGFIICALFALFLTWYVIRPVTGLERYARLWQLGQPWDLAQPTTGPEIESLFACLRDMAGRLNQQFAREQDLARFKSQLVSLVSHEFNNALSVINGVSLLLEDSEPQPAGEKRENYYRMLKSNIRALQIAANNLLNMGQLDSGKFALTLRRTLIREVVQQSLQRLEILSLRKGLKVAVDLPEVPIPVKADPEALSLVATNLLSNAIKYTPENGRILVKVEEDKARPGWMRVSFSDTGIGISPEDQELIFSGFFRTKEGKSAAKGFGVGLSLAKRILEAHDSRLEVASEPGKGATFSFLLPIFAEGSEDAA